MVVGKLRSGPCLPISWRWSRSLRTLRNQIWRSRWHGRCASMQTGDNVIRAYQTHTILNPQATCSDDVGKRCSMNNLIQLTEWLNSEWNGWMDLQMNIDPDLQTTTRHIWLGCRVRAFVEPCDVVWKCQAQCMQCCGASFLLLTWLKKAGDISVVRDFCGYRLPIWWCVAMLVCGDIVSPSCIS